MGYHLIAYFENQDGAGVRTELAALSDPFTNLFPLGTADEFRVHPDFNEVLGVYLGLEQTVDVSADLFFPTSRKLYGIERFSLPFINDGAEPTSPPLFNDFRPHPIVVPGGDRLKLFSVNNPGAAADQFGVVFMGKNVAPVDPKGGFWSRFTTAASAMNVNTWNRRPLVADETLQEIEYEILGIDPGAGSTSAIAVRLDDGRQVNRPGVIAKDDVNDEVHDAFKKPGSWGVLGHHSTDKPVVSEWLVDAADNEAQELYLYLRPVGGRRLA